MGLPKSFLSHFPDLDFEKVHLKLAFLSVVILSGSYPTFYPSQPSQGFLHPLSCPVAYSAMIFSLLFESMLSLWKSETHNLRAEPGSQMCFWLSQCWSALFNNVPTYRTINIIKNSMLSWETRKANNTCLKRLQWTSCKSCLYCYLHIFHFSFFPADCFYFHYFVKTVLVNITCNHNCPTQWSLLCFCLTWSFSSIWYLITL